MIDVEVQNFQSIEQCTLTIDGFTALVGRSNLGKSALVRALKAALTGASGTAFVRHAPSCARRLKGVKTCDCRTTVSIKGPNFDLKWEKGDKINRYTFNGAVYDRAEQGTPDFLQRPHLEKDLGLVEVGRKGRLLQVADQFDNVFLLDQTGGAVADVLSDVANLDRINIALRLVEKDRKEATATRKVLEKDVVDISKQVTAFQTLDELTAATKQIAGMHAAIAKEDSKVEKLSTYFNELEALGFRIDGLKQAAEVPVPDKTAVDTAATKVEQLDRFIQAATERLQIVKAYSGIGKVEEPQISPLQDKMGQHMQLDGWVSKLQLLQHDFQRFKGLDDVCIPEQSASPKLLTELDGYVRRVVVLQAAIDRLTAQYEEAEKEEAVVMEEINTLGVCPTCTHPLSGAHTHARTA